MIGWLIFTAYVVVWLLFGWRLTVAMVDAEVRRSLRDYAILYEKFPRPAEEAARKALGFNLAIGFLMAYMWPVTLPGCALYRLATRSRLFVPPSVREEAERFELEALRKLASEHNLEMPEVPR